MKETESNIWTELSNRPTTRPTTTTDGLKIGLAVATLVLGIVSIAMSILVTGAVFGLTGAILGISCLIGKSAGKKMAGWGLGLSVVGILLSCLFALAYYSAHVQRNKGLDNNNEKTGLFDEWIGQKAPDITLTDVEGNSIKLSELKGKRVVLNFWGTWWIRDRDTIPHFIELRKTIPEEELVIIGISKANAEEVRGVGRQVGINYPIVSTNKLPPPFNKVHLTPVTFFIDSNGVIQSVLKGYHSLEKLKSRALAPNYEKDEEKEDQTIRSIPLSDN